MLAFCELRVPHTPCARARRRCEESWHLLSRSIPKSHRCCRRPTSRRVARRFGRFQDGVDRATHMARLLQASAQKGAAWAHASGRQSPNASAIAKWRYVRIILRWFVDRSTAADTDLAMLARALGHPTRVYILRALRSRGSASVSELVHDCWPSPLFRSISAYPRSRAFRDGCGGAWVAATRSTSIASGDSRRL